MFDARGHNQGDKITTIEGLDEDGTCTGVAAFVKQDAFQCGYCTPGQICSAAGLIAEGNAKTPEEIRELMSGNICRCGAYPNIVAAIQQAMGAVMIKFPVFPWANNVADAVRQIAADRKARFIAGGTNLIDLMKEEVERPSRLIDITHLPLKGVEETADGRIAHRRAGSEFRSRLSPAGRAALSGPRKRDSRRRLGATAQHGFDRR